ncbi:OmpA family protein [Pelomonas sp. KK5]|uniref:OmpA family protein n=1 Tax=Pelomonas sp. KK5 TaxID=1855730 RepID=UPI00097C0C80|nr:OmpA family protein [Pelomonas sp. KK5]
MNNKTRLACSALSLSLLAACSNMTPEQKGTAQGAGIGAAGGAILGALVGNRNTAATGAVIGAAAGAIGGNIWSRKMEERQRALEQKTQGTGVEVTRTADNQLKVNIPSDISFDVGRADIKPNLRGVLDDFAYGLKDDPAVNVRIVGHTDNTGSDAVNDPLSQRRADSVRGYLEDRGVAGSRIQTTGRGEHEPIADNATEAGRAKNRRVEIYLREPEQRG